MPPDGAYTMEQQGVSDQALSGDGMDPSLAAPAQMDPSMMAQLFGSDDESQEAAPDAEGATDQGTDQGTDQVDQGKLQAVLSDPGLLMAVAQVLKTLGQGDDTDLVHVTEEEKQALKQGGGEGTPNPTTGLLQYLKKDDLEAPDWFGMHPDDRVSMIGSGRWRSPRSAVDPAQGGPTKNMTGEDFANANVAVTPSWGTAMNMAGLVTGMTGMLGPATGIVSALAKSAIGSLASNVFGDDSILAGIGDFNTPGPRLSQEDLSAIADAYNEAALRGLPTAQVLNAGEQALAAARGKYGGGPGAQTGGPGPGLSAGVGVDQAGNAYGTNIGGAGVSHNLAGGLANAIAAANAARAAAARGFGAYGRASPAGSGRDAGGRDANTGGDGSNAGGSGADGGRHGGPGGSNRSA